MTETAPAPVPHPGSRLDATARAAGQEMPAETIGDVTGEALLVVPVAEALPGLGRGYVVILGAANPVLRLLPQDPQRRSAIILAVDNDVYIGSTLESVQAAAGTATGTSAAYLPKGVPVPIANKAAWYAGITTAATQSRLSVLISADEE